MRRTELIALRATALSWERLTEFLPPTLEAVGLVHDPAAPDGEVTVLDHGAQGRIVLFDRAVLARRAALALSTRAGVSVNVFEVIGTASSKRYRFRTTAFKATASGELLPAEGKELDLEDPAQLWGGGDLDKQTQRVLEEFALLEGGAERSLRLGYKRKPTARPSTPRVATLIASLQKAKSHQAAPQAGGRIELSIDLAAGGKQISYCTEAEYQELERLLGKA